MSRRYEISDGHWLRVSHLLLGKAGDPGRTAADNRLFVNASSGSFAAGPRGPTCPDGTAPTVGSQALQPLVPPGVSGSGSSRP